MRGLDVTMRAWHEAAAKLAVVVARDVEGSMSVPETCEFARKVDAVTKAIEKAGGRPLEFADFESEFSAFEDSSDEGEL